jgi:3-oxoacyl-[acyl-carrier protein] reductase
MNLGLNEKVFVISGSSRGIGLGIAAALAAENAHVLLNGRNQKDLKAAYHTVSDIGVGDVLCVQGDITDSRVVSDILQVSEEKWGRIDGVIANAGAVKTVPNWDIDKKDWQWFLDSNLIVATQFVTPLISLLTKTKGSIVFIGSIAGIEEIGAPLPYSAAKAALSMYAKGLARKLAADSVRVNVVNPGNVLFDGGNWDRKLQSDPKETRALIAKNVPMNDFATPEDIAGITLFLLSEQARFITGSSIAVDGGQTSLFI